MENNNQLKKSLGVSAAMALVVGCVIGAGVFFKPYAIYQATGGAPGMGMLAWIIGGIASLLGALTFAEVAVMIPKTGGMVAYLGDAFHEKLGFLAGWMQTVIFYPAFLAGYGITVGNELTALLGLSPAFQLPIAIALIALLIGANSLGSKAAGNIQLVSTICKLIPLFILMIFGFILGSGDNAIFAPMVGEGKNTGAVLGSTLLAVLFAFEGWTNVGAIAGEMKNPGKDMPKAIVGGVSIIMAVYFVINLAYLWVLPADELMNLTSPASAVAMKLFGPVGGTLVTVGIIISVIGAANGFLLSGSRVAFHLAELGTLPASATLRKLNNKQVPINSILLIGVVGAIYCFVGRLNLIEGMTTFDLLTNLAVFSCWIFYTLTFASVIRLRKTMPDAERKYKVPLYPVIPILAIASGLYVVISQLFLDSVQTTIISLCSIAITLLGLPVYLLVKKKEAK
ncbi:MAG: amino acid permease [Ruminococcaceae bacterium]|nr:amino acid permease [Oscillospiraceae bacterium]